MPDIQIGDLIKYDSHIDGQNDMGVWLVVYAEDDPMFGRLVTLRTQKSLKIASVNVSIGPVVNCFKSSL